MRRCPNCHRWLSPWVLMYPRTEMACPHCWAILKVSAWRALFFGAALGFVVEVVILFRFGVAVTRPEALRYHGRSGGGLFGLPILMGYLAGVFFPRLTVEPEQPDKRNSGIDGDR